LETQGADDQGDGTQEPHVSHGITEPEEQDGTQDGADRSQEDGSRSESARRALRHDIALVMWEMLALNAIPVKGNLPAWVSGFQDGTMAAIGHDDLSMQHDREGEAA